MLHKLWICSVFLFSHTKTVWRKIFNAPTFQFFMKTQHCVCLTGFNRQSRIWTDSDVFKCRTESCYVMFPSCGEKNVRTVSFVANTKDYSLFVLFVNCYSWIDLDEWNLFLKNFPKLMKIFRNHWKMKTFNICLFKKIYKYLPIQYNLFLIFNIHVTW